MLRRLAQMMLRSRRSDDVAVLDRGNASMEAAIAQARETLPVFWRKFESGEAESYQLKAALTTPNGATEHVWIYTSGWRDERVVGVLASKPMDLGDISAGDEVLIDPERISDWVYFKQGLLYGGFTQRVTLNQLKPAMR